MFRDVRQLALVLALLLGGCGDRSFTVCADPDNLPFSSKGSGGLENEVAEILAADLGRELRYHWWSQRRGFVRNTLGEGACDAWMGVPSGLETVLTTRPYYRSAYVFVTRAGDGLAGLTLDDPRLRELDLGVQLAGDDGANPPPADALARRGLTARTRGFMLHRDSGQDIFRALAEGDLDVALVWGPAAGWHAARSPVPLRLEPITPAPDGPSPMAFAISIGVARNDEALRVDLDQALKRNRARISRVVEAYRVPRAGGA